MRFSSELRGIAVPLTFAFAPVTAFILATQDVLLPVGSSIARIALVLVCAIGVLYIVLRRWNDQAAASNIIAVPCVSIALYPIAHATAGSLGLQAEYAFAWCYLVLSAAAAPVVARWPHERARIVHDGLTVAGLAVLLGTLFVVARAYVFERPFPPPVAAAVAHLSSPLPTGSVPGAHPDVFHLVLDGMGRPDVLEKEYGMRIDAQLAEFRALGFHIDSAVGHANYVQTHLSLASMLNVDYLDELTTIPSMGNFREPLRELLWRARVPDLFTRLGYHVEFIGPGSRSEGAFASADRCDCPQLWFSEPEVGALTLTPLKVFLRFGLGQERFFQRSLHVFEAFERRQTASAPRYVYAHAMLPHPPFVSDERGQFQNPRRPLSGADGTYFPGTADEYRAGYRAQATFTLRRTLDAVTRVLAQADRDGREVVVIVHGDHGPRLGFDARNPDAESGRFSLPVLLAVRWPKGMVPASPPSSLVNVYRTVFREVFKLGLQPLPDRSFVSGFSRPYALVESAPYKATDSATGNRSDPLRQ
jgi:hypothetical protein